MATAVRRVRAFVPERAPVGAVLVWDGALVLTHYGTHGTVAHPVGWRPGSATEAARARDAFAARGEPAEWRVYGDDPAELREAVREAGFVAGPERTVLVADPAELPAAAGAVRAAYGRDDLARVAELAGAAGEQRTPFAEFLADGSAARPDARVLVLVEEGRITAAGWAEKPPGTEVAVLCGLTAPRPELVAAWAGWAADRRRGGAARHVLAEATGPLRAFLERHGLRPAGTVTPYRWDPPGGPAAAERPVRQLFDDPEHDALWDAWRERFAFRPSTVAFPGIAEPPDSATWRLCSDHRDAVQAAVERALRAAARPDEPLHWLNWQHPGYRFDPSRVGAAGQPPWPGTAWPDGDYHLHLTTDLRLGTFAHPWERTLCAFGPALLPHLEPALTRLLGPPLRRAGR
ncbi:DUF2716 domain-containing protein [Streptomyces sp. B6B3]|uniref:DUF2716 domain-containing protein n=1 Tax=Streptomyces sp. B6B3 TaxID=3153570 RepID=UPI00325F0E78